MDNQILILTLVLDHETRLFFNKLRKQHFPAGRNYLDAHLTLFHNLPGNEVVIAAIQEICANTIAFNLQITQIVSIGNGVAYKAKSEELQLLHKVLQQQFKQWLIPQDKQTLWPHITIQNKTNPAIANQLITDLSTDFQQFKANVLGIAVWEYKNGPWEFIKEYKFKN